MFSLVKRSTLPDIAADVSTRCSLHARLRMQQNAMIRDGARSDIKGPARQLAPSSAGSSADDQFLGVPVFLFKERGRLPRRAGRQTRGAEPWHEEAVRNRAATSRYNLKNIYIHNSFSAFEGSSRRRSRSLIGATNRDRPRNISNMSVMKSNSKSRRSPGRKAAPRDTETPKG